MSLTSPNVPTMPCVVRDPSASSVILQRVRPELADAFIEWQRGISAAAESFLGYRGTDLYPPASGTATDWVSILHFDDAAQLGRWLESPERAVWIAKIPGGVDDFQLKTISNGFGAWFSGPAARTPGWKMVLLVLLGLYPTVMVLAILLGPFLAPLGMATSMVLSNLMSVATLQWVIMPFLQHLFTPWLVPNPNATRTRSAAWVAGIVIALAVFVVLFRQIKG